MLNTLIGEDAGLVWNLLSKKGMLTIQELIRLTGYRESYIHLALGWLSRENKICYLEQDDNLMVALKIDSVK